jgi:hypothetical protein
LIGGVALQRRSPFGDGMIEQFKDQSECGQVVLFNRSIIVALQGFTNDRIDFPLRCQQILFGPGIAKLRDHGENPVAMAGGVVPIVPIQIATQPRGGRTDPGKKEQGEPEVVAVLVQKGPLGPVDDRSSAPVHGGLRLLLCLGLCDVRSAGNALRDRVADSEKLPVEGRRLAQGPVGSQLGKNLQTVAAAHYGNSL